MICKTAVIFSMAVLKLEVSAVNVLLLVVPGIPVVVFVTDVVFPVRWVSAVWCGGGYII